MTSLTVEEENVANDVIEFIKCIDSLAKSLKACKEAGVDVYRINEVINESIPEENRPAFQEQWPMISMLLSML